MDPIHPFTPVHYPVELVRKSLSLIAYVKLRRPREESKILQTVLKECLVLFFGSLIYPIPATLLDPKIDQKPSQTPILLIHGYFHNSSAWHYFRWQMQKRRITPIYTIDLGSPFLSIEEYAQKVLQKMVDIQKESDCKEIILVGHSMGGVIATYLAAHHDSSLKIKKVVTIGAPLQGTLLSLVGWGRAIYQMQILSPFIRDLIAKIKKRADLIFCHIGSTKDQIVIPYQATFLPSANSRNYLIDSCGHFSYLYSREVIEIVAREVSII